MKRIEISEAKSTGDFLKCALFIGMPVVIQNMISSLINALDVFMLGQLGEVTITASSVSNQWFLLYCILANGIAAAAAIFIAQYWGRRDRERIHHYMGILFILAALLAVVFAGIAVCFPQKVLGLYSMDALVVEEGTKYLRIMGICFLLYACNSTCATALRCIGETRVPMLATVFSLLFNALGNYLLIFGNLGFWELGITGAAIATVIARFAELIVNLGYIVIKKSPVSGPVREFLSISKAEAAHFVHYGGLVILGELVYAVGNNLYNVAYKYAGTQAQASLQIIQTLQSLALLFCGGIGAAASTMLGSMLGTGDFERAKRCSRVLTVFAIAAGVVTGIVAIALTPLILQLFQIGETSRSYVEIMIRIMALTIPLRTVVYMVICGILRSGGDNLPCFWANLFGVWAVGLPLVFLAAVVFELPIYVIYAMSAMEEAGKLLICGPRVLKGKWLKNLTAV